jgi:hypothetical protein
LSEGIRVRGLRLLLLFSCAVAATIATTCGVVSRPGRFSPPGELIDEARFQDYHVKVYRRDLEGFGERIFKRLPSVLADFSYRVPGMRAWSGAEILQNGRRVFSCHGANLAIAQFGSNNVVGTDVTGDGNPNIALTDSYNRWSGGELYLFECGKTFRKIAVIESIADFPEFRDFDGDGMPEVMASDNSFYHFPSPRDGSPMPTLILRWQNGRYVAAKNLMAKAPPAKEELEVIAARWRSAWDPEEVAEASDKFSATVLGLLYSGHDCQAWEFIDAGFDDPLEKEDFVRQLQSRLEESVYWPDLR